MVTDGYNKFCFTVVLYCVLLQLVSVLLKVLWVDLKACFYLTNTAPSYWGLSYLLNFVVHDGMHHTASWTTIVVHSRDNQEVGVAHEVKSPKNKPQFFQMTMGQYWLGKTKPKQAQIDHKYFQKVAMKF